MHFYTLKEAAAAVAVELHPDHPAKRDEVAGIYWHVLYEALRDNQITGRDASTRLAIPPSRTGAMIAFQQCLISETDLNEWIDRIGIGVQAMKQQTVSVVTSNLRFVSQSPSSIPTDAAFSTPRLASALAPYLANGKDVNWLLDLLSNASKRPALCRYRRLAKPPHPSTWNPAGVVHWLVRKRHMTGPRGRTALAHEYPSYLDIAFHME